MSDIAIKVENISKKYQIGENKQFPTLRDKLMEIPNRIFKGPKKTKEFWALKDVSFDVKKGEVLGIIGRNGAGKSTLLKILARITEPTSGQVTMYGRVASMLEVGTGFNQELTGRENIFLNGAIIGMTKKEIQTKFDDIVEFSGVGKFLDTPVKHYSSGMYVRLAFAVAAHLDADILLVDEVLAVGDSEFQQKCLGKISDLAQSGRSIIFISHNLEAVGKLCSRIIVMENGKKIIDDNTTESINQYEEKFQIISSNFIGPLRDKIKIESISVNGVTSKKCVLEPEDIIKIGVKGISLVEIPNMKITVSVYKNDIRVFTLHDTVTGSILLKGGFKSSVTIPSFTLRPDIYTIYVGGYQEGTSSWFYGERLARFQIRENWSVDYQQMNLGLINLANTGKRIKL